MGLLKTPPKIRVRMPRVVQTGTDCVVEVELSARRELSISAVSVHLLGTERVAVGDWSRSINLISLAAKVCGERTLPAGDSRFSARLSLPKTLPSTYRGSAASTSYVLDVHVDIPWWRDARESFVVHVARPPVEIPPEPRPIVYSSNTGGPKGREPYVELSLTDQVVASGGSIVGAVALGNVAHNAYTGVALGMTLIEVVNVHGQGRQVRSEVRSAELDISRLAEGVAIPFSLNVGDLAPNDASELWRIEWRLSVQVSRRFGRDLGIEVPLRVVASGQARSAAMKARIPRLGGERIDAVWRAVATRFDLELVNAELVGRRGDVAFRVWREHKHRRGWRVLSLLEFPSLELHIDGGERAAFRRVFGTHDAPGESDWEKRHYLTGRERAQVELLWRALFERVASFERLADLTVSDFSDQRLSLELTDAGQNERALGELTELVIATASALPGARAALPAPVRMASAVPAWQASARALGGTLDPGSMAISAVLDGQRVRIATIWHADGTLRHTEVTLRPEPALGIRYTLEWTESDGVLEGDLEHLPRSACEIFVELERDSRAVTIEAEQLSALLDAPLMDPEPACAALHRLVELCAALRTRAGAYR